MRAAVPAIGPRHARNVGNGRMDDGARRRSINTSGSRAVPEVLAGIGWHSDVRRSLERKAIFGGRLNDFFTPA